jgi:co-chaperonin GroES (HSP10)
MLTPLGRRVLVQPDAPETVTEGGLLIPEKAQDRIAMSGTIVAVGPLCQGPSFHVKTQLLTQVEHVIEQVASRAAHTDWTEDLLADLRVALDRYVETANDGLKVGMCVAFPYTVGMDVTVDGDDFIVLDEQAIVAAWMPEAARVETAA